MQDNKEIGKQTQQGDHRGEKAGMGLGGMDGRVLCGFDCSHKMRKVRTPEGTVPRKARAT